MSKIINFPRPARRPFVPTIVARAPAEVVPLTPMETVTFRRPFTLPGLIELHSPGTFEVRHEREALDLSWQAWRVTTTILLTDGAITEALDVKADDLASALELDRAEIA